MKRVFIAINLPDNIKKQLIKFQEKWSDFPVRWVRAENLHLTLAFLGNLSDEEVGKICQDLKGVKLKQHPFLINLVKISYGPQGKKIPGLVWAEGERSDQLDFLREEVNNTLEGSIGFSSERRDFLPHITMGRIRKWEWRKIEPEERPDILENISFSFEVRSIEIMESELKRTGAEYVELGSISLKEHE